MAPALALDLVPRSCWFSNLRSELSRKDWDLLRRAQYAKAGHRCEICGGRGRKHPVECHERWAYRDEDRTQVLVGLIALCPACHEVKHFGLAERRGRLQQALAHYRKVNGVGEVEAVEQIRREFDLWAERSRVEWGLDLSWLATVGLDPVMVEKGSRLARDVEDGEVSKACEIVLQAFEREFGPCPSDQARFAVIHSCGHASALQVPDPDSPDADPRALQGLGILLAEQASAPCFDCLAPIEWDTPGERESAPEIGDPGEGRGSEPIERSERSRGSSRAREVVDSDGRRYELE